MEIKNINVIVKDTHEQPKELALASSGQLLIFTEQDVQKYTIGKITLLQNEK